MSEELIQDIEKSVKDVTPSAKFSPASPAGDVGIEYLDKAFTQIESWVELKLKDSRYKSLVITQMEFMYMILRAAVAKALT